MAHEALLYNLGQVRFKKGGGDPATTDALLVYGVPDVDPQTEVLDDPTYTPQGDALPSAIGRDNPAISLGVVRAQEFTVPSADDATRPNWGDIAECCGYKTAVHSDQTTVTDEATGQKGDGTVTRFVFLTNFAGLQAGEDIVVKAGAQAITIAGADDAVTGDGTVSQFDRASGFLDVSFTAAPAADVAITVSYKSGYVLRYDRSNSGKGGSSASVEVTREHDSQTVEDVRRANGFRGNMPLAISQAGNLEYSPTGSGTVADEGERAVSDPVYPEETANLVWDDTCTVVAFTVEADGANVQKYVGQVPTFALDPGFTFQRPEGGVTPGYSAEAELLPASPQLTIDWFALAADDFNLQSLLKNKKQLNVRIVVPGVTSPKNLKVFTQRGQITAPGSASAGFGGKEQRSTGLKCLTMGNEVSPPVSATAPRQRIDAITLP